MCWGRGSLKEKSIDTGCRNDTHLKRYADFPRLSVAQAKRNVFEETGIMHQFLGTRISWAARRDTRLITAPAINGIR